LTAAFGYGLFFSYLARRTSKRIAWRLCCAVSAILVGLGIRGSVPSVALAGLIGRNAAEQVTLESLHSAESFGDGTASMARMTGDEAAVDAIVEELGLVASDSQHLLFESLFREHAFPEDGEYYGADRNWCYYDRAARTIYFIRMPPRRAPPDERW